MAIISTNTQKNASLQEQKTVTPQTVQVEVTPDLTYEGLKKVIVNAVPVGTEGTPTATKGTVSNHSVNVTPSVTNTAGLIAGGTHTGTPVSVSAAELVSGTKRVTQNGTEDVTNYASVEVDVQAQPDLQDKTVTPDTDDTVVTADAGYDGLRQVTVEGDEYFVPENIAAGVTIWGKTGTYAGGGGSTFSTFENGIETIYTYLTFTQSGGTVAFTTPAMQDKTVIPDTAQQEITADAGYVGLHKVTVTAMPPGTEGVPTAVKGAVHNHAMQVTPQVTNQEGYIPGTTKTGTPVSVSAAELVSGTKQITANGTDIDVADYQKVDVAVPVGTDVSDTTATAGDVLAGKDFHLADGTKTTGTIQSQLAQTIYPSTQDQSIPAGKYIAGSQIIKAVKVSQNLVAANVAQGVTVTIGDVDDPDRILSVTGTHQGGSVWEPVTPIDLGPGSFLGGNNTLAIGYTNYPSYRTVALDLQTLDGKIIYIDNSHNNRGLWGLFSSLSNGQAIAYPSTNQHNKTLTFYANDFYRLARYLAYDFTSSNQSQPAIYAMTVTAPST